MRITTYAEGHFPTEFAKLPPLESYNWDTTPLRKGCQRLATGIELCNDHERKISSSQLFGCLETSFYGKVTVEIQLPRQKGLLLNEPFCWIKLELSSHPYLTSKSPMSKKLTAFILYCFLLKGHSEVLQFFDDDCISDFQQACKDVAQGPDAKRSLLGVTTQSVDHSTARDFTTSCFCLSKLTFAKPLKTSRM